MKQIGFVITLVLASVGFVFAQEPSPMGDPSFSEQSVISPRPVLIIGGIDNHTVNGTHLGLSSAEIYDQQTKEFVATGSLNQGRTGHDATLLSNGQILVTGGDGDTNLTINSAELYDPNTGHFRLTGNMETPRVGHTAVLLSDGQVLVAGGQNATSTNQSSAELYNTQTGTFTPTGNMTEPRTGHTAILLSNGKVLIAGGENQNGLLADAELYDPKTGAFTPTGRMSIPRLFATAVRLQDGRVLIAGGGSVVGNCSGCSVASAEIYDPITGTFTTVGSMANSRRGHIAVRLANGNVLVAGGINDSLPNSLRVLRAAEVFDVNTLTFVPTSSMSTPRADHGATLLSDGSVLITGGFIDGFTITDTAELYKPTKGLFVVTGSMTDARAEHTSTRY